MCISGRGSPGLAEMVSISLGDRWPSRGKVVGRGSCSYQETDIMYAHYLTNVRGIKFKNKRTRSLLSQN